MAPSAANRQSPPPPENTDKNLQPFFVLHEASSSSSCGKRSNRRSRTEPSPAGTDHDQQLLMQSSFDLAWSKIESTVKDVLKNINSKAFHQIHGWVCESFDALTSESIHSKTLFTGLVLTRHLDFLDDLMTFKELALHLKSNGCRVASLSPLDFLPKNGIGGCLRNLLKQFLATTLDAPDLSILFSWYKEQGNNAPVVVIIEDLERCSGSILSDFILMLSEWIPKVPVILIAGVATILEFPRNALHSNALQCLCPFKFSLGTSVERMDAIVEAVLVEPCAGFYISHKVAGFMRNNFINQDGTITSFLRALKIACAEHFFSEPLSFMLRGFVEDDLQESEGGSSDPLLKEIPKETFDSMCSERNKRDRGNIEELIEGVLEMKKQLRHWSMVVMCLYDAGKYGKITLLDLLCEALNPEVWKSTVSDTCKKKAEGSECPSANRSLHTPRSRGYIAQALYKVRELPLSMLDNLLESWGKRTIDTQEIHNKVKRLKHMLKSEGSRKINEESVDIERRHASRPCSTTVKVSRDVNEMAASFLEDLTRDYMQPIECIASHEIVCYKKVDKLQMALIGDPRRQIQVDLLEVSKTLCCPCCPKISNTLLPSMHDTSIMYTLCQEHGDLVNICDWYQSFKSILHQPTSKRKHTQKQSPASKKRKVNEAINTSEVAAQARFCRAVAELQIVGLLRMQSKRRPHFLQRVAFGL